MGKVVQLPTVGKTAYTGPPGIVGYCPRSSMYCPGLSRICVDPNSFGLYLYPIFIFFCALLCRWTGSGRTSPIVQPRFSLGAWRVSPIVPSIMYTLFL
jgi:hypothetical protein